MPASHRKSTRAKLTLGLLCRETTGDRRIACNERAAERNGESKWSWGGLRELNLKIMEERVLTCSQAMPPITDDPRADDGGLVGRVSLRLNSTVSCLMLILSANSTTVFRSMQTPRQRDPCPQPCYQLRAIIGAEAKS